MFNWIGIARRILRMLYQMCYIVLLTDIVYVMFNQPLVDIKWMGLLFVILTLSYIFRDKSHSGFILLLLHIVMGAVVWFIIPNPYLTLVVEIHIAIMYSDGLYYISRGYTLNRMFDVPWGSLFVGIAAAVLGDYMNRPEIVRMGYIIPIIIIILFLISLYLEGLEEYINSTRYVSGAPIKQIVSVNSLIISGIICLILVMLLLADVLKLGNALSGLFSGLISVIKILFMLMLLFVKYLMSHINTSYKKMSISMDDVIEETDRAWSLMSVIRFIFIIMCFIIAAYVIIKSFKWFIRLILRKMDKGVDIKEDINPKKIYVKKERIKKQGKLSGTDPVMKARRIYKKKVLSFRRSFSPDKYDTTGDISAAMERSIVYKDGSDEFSPEKLTELYNAVRYGNAVPDKKYLNEMKKSCENT